MSAINHPAYKEELDRCDYTLQYVEKSLAASTQKKAKLDQDLDYLKRHYNEESSSDYTNLMVSTLLHDSLALKLRNLVTAMSKPYFARIDFKESDSSTEKLYIGKMSLVRDEDQEIIIVDWRAPIANLYYEGRLGDCSYNCPEGLIHGQLMLKRQFAINNGVLEEIFDIDITTSDEFLQSYLGAKADSRLKEIVSTIQVEQNEIIRADMWKPLIVQGAAGSGKTTIALHRIAYLIYMYEKTFEPENFMIIAPSRFFLNYISEVLPELGVERVKQATFEEFALELIGKKLKIKEPNEKLIAFVDHNVTPKQRAFNSMLRRCSEFKSSMQFKYVMDAYVSHIEKTFIPREHFKIGSKIIFRYEDINKLFLYEYKRWPVVQRVNEIKKHLASRLKLQKTAIINSLHEDCDERIAHLKSTMDPSDARQELIIAAIDGKNDTISKLENFSKKAVNEYISKISKFSPYDYYKDLMVNLELFTELAHEACNRDNNEASKDLVTGFEGDDTDNFNGFIDKELIEFTVWFTTTTIKSKYVDIEDIAPIIYLKYCIYGMDEKIPVKHIVIDEAQDFSVFQFYVLKKIVKDSSFTILGDLCQAIHSYRGIRSWQEVMSMVFDDRYSKYLTLEQSYRTTVEIMDAANTVIKKLDDEKLILAKPVIRHGQKVLVTKKDEFKDIVLETQTLLQNASSEGFKSIAIICKTMEECIAMQTSLKKLKHQLYVLTGKDDVYRGGMVIVPSYLSKGLEFDVVIIANAGAEQYKEDDDLDIKLLYVAMTRALHRLHIFYIDTPSPLLDDL